MVDFDALTRANLSRWQNAKLNRKPLSDSVAKNLVSAKPRYQAVENKTGVPWAVIAVIHERESSQNWGRSLAQGDPWDRVSINVPAGRGPFKSWEDAAIDALVNCPPRLARHKDWSLGGTLVNLEMYNGLGYASGPMEGRYPPQASPYLWAGTDQYKKGKYTRDKFFDPEVADSQLGCAAMLIAMMAIDPTITFTGAKITPINPTPVPIPQPAPQPSFWAFVLSLIEKLWRK